ncbi:SUKH superfamily protein [Nocardia tenerifensis]|uniref:SUKH superfamily protein n=1 Tax=Nocardia tenerifensis TaxID=228006 RepID=A0A318K132_9NOCA|nr:SMI1/KNR4 family protein [Nocardia tenerifensis]PXX60865.1 SUKH superfamily protein [Nocardia tenerifensis]
MIKLSGLFCPDTPPFEAPADNDLIKMIEGELGLRLPDAYVALARIHNGGYLTRSVHPADTPTTWSADHVAVTSLAAIGRTAAFSLGGEMGSRFWVEEWGYPDIGVYFADCPSAGHDMIALDYRGDDEPSVVHVDQDLGYRITTLAPSFAAFVNGLVREEPYISRAPNDDESAS